MDFDSSSEAVALQMKIHERMSGPERLVLALQMIQTVQTLALSRLRLENPDSSESDIRRLFIRTLHGVDV